MSWKMFGQIVLLMVIGIALLIIAKGLLGCVHKGKLWPGEKSRCYHQSQRSNLK